MELLVVYDIAHPKRLYKVAKILKNYGVRVQKSKFEIQCQNARELEALCKQLEDVIDQQKDGVKLIPLCFSCRNKKIIFDASYSPKSAKEYYII